MHLGLPEIRRATGTTLRPADATGPMPRPSYAVTEWGLTLAVRLAPADNVGRATDRF